MLFEFILFTCTWELIENTFLTRPTPGELENGKKLADALEMWQHYIHSTSA